MGSLITLTTDFGLKDSYVGTMKGVILGINPQATIVDLCHEIEPQNVRQAAFVLYTAYRYFPRGTIHVVVVDPGVGSERRAIALRTPMATFVAPDNGVLSYVVADEEVERVVSLTNPQYWLAEVSSTFHGRDIFAPLAAHLSLGVPLEELGEALAEIVTFSVPQPEIGEDGTLRGHIIHVDRFGNLITDVKQQAARLSQETIIEVRGHRIVGLRRTYAEAAKGEILALIGSSGHLEIAMRGGSAMRTLGMKVGDEVKIRNPALH